MVDEQSNDAAASVRNIADSINNNEQRVSAALVENGIINNDVAAPVRNITANIDDNEQLNDVAFVENIGNQAWLMSSQMMRLLLFITLLPVWVITSS